MCLVKCEGKENWLVRVSVLVDFGEFLLLTSLATTTFSLYIVRGLWRRRKFGETGRQIDREREKDRSSWHHTESMVDTQTNTHTLTHSSPYPQTSIALPYIGLEKVEKVVVVV